MAFSAAAIAAAAIVAAAAVSAYSAYEQGQTQNAIAKYNARVAQNAAIAKRQEAAIARENEHERNQAILAAQRAGIGAAGVISTEGTPLLVQLDSAEKAALNEARITYSGEVGAQKYEAEKIIQGYIGKRALQQGYIQAGASLLQGASSAYGASSGTYGRGRTTAA